MANINSPPKNLIKAFIFCALAYIFALFVAAVVGYLFREMHPLLIVLYADVAGTLAIYTFGRIFGNASFYDAYWSVAPLAIALYWILRASSNDGVTARQIIIITLVFAWGLRLTFNWARKWQGLKHEDWRYQNLRKKVKKWFWLLDLVGIELMPTVLVFLACLSLYPALAAGKNTFGTLDIIAIPVTAGAIIIETIADEQLKNFIRKKTRPGEIMSGGLWNYSRHPNYLGEVMFWWGLYIFALSADPGYWWAIIGPGRNHGAVCFHQYPYDGQKKSGKKAGIHRAHEEDFGFPAMVSKDVINRVLRRN
jgi:steroid 5-alpha reductase family enzyme